MADKKLSEAAERTVFDGTEYLSAIAGGENYRIPMSLLATDLRVFRPTDPPFNAKCNGDPTDPDEGDDDAQALLDCLDAAGDAAVANQPVTVDLQRGTSNLYKCESAPLVTPLGVQMRFNGTQIGFTSALDGEPRLWLSGPNAATTNQRLHFTDIVLRRIGTDGGPWSGDAAWAGFNKDDVMLRLSGLQECYVHFNIFGGSIGWQPYGDAQPQTENTIVWGAVRSTRVQHHVYSTGVDAAWNENLITGGAKCRNDFGLNNSLGGRGIWLDPAGGGYSLHNGNVYEKISYQLQAQADRIPIYLECGVNNDFDHFRDEANGSAAPFARASLTAARNRIGLPGFTDRLHWEDALVDLSTKGSNWL